MKNNKGLQVQKNEGDDKGRQCQPENPSQQVRNFKSVQNRQAEKDRLQTKNDYEVDLKAEMEIMQLHEKINELRDFYWQDLITMQQQQIKLLERIINEVCPGDKPVRQGSESL